MCESNELETGSWVESILSGANKLRILATADFEAKVVLVSETEGTDPSGLVQVDVRNRSRILPGVQFKTFQNWELIGYTRTHRAASPSTSLLMQRPACSLAATLTMETP